MIYTSDTRPETISIDQAKERGTGRGRVHPRDDPSAGTVDHEEMGLTYPDHGQPEFDAVVIRRRLSKTVPTLHRGPSGTSSARSVPRPELTVITHFPMADDTVACALNSVKAHCPWVVWDPEHPNSSNLIWSTDLMVLSVKPGGITQIMGVVSDYTFGAPRTCPG